MPNKEVAELLTVHVRRCRINGCRRTQGHDGEHMDSEALSEYVIASHERYIDELESRLLLYKSFMREVDRQAADYHLASGPKGDAIGNAEPWKKLDPS